MAQAQAFFHDLRHESKTNQFTPYMQKKRDNAMSIIQKNLRVLMWNRRLKKWCKLVRILRQQVSLRDKKAKARSQLIYLQGLNTPTGQTDLEGNSEGGSNLARRSSQLVQILFEFEKEGFAHLEVVKGSKPVHYTQQGNVDFYTAEALQKREDLWNNDDIQGILRLFWHVVSDSLDHQIHWHQYRSLMLSIMQALISDFDKSKCEAIVSDDWLSDTGFEAPDGHMTEEQLCKSLFELVDNWVDSMESQDYIEFLKQLFVGIAHAKKKTEGEHEEKNTARGSKSPEEKEGESNEATQTSETSDPNSTEMMANLKNVVFKLRPNITYAIDENGLMRTRQMDGVVEDYMTSLKNMHREKYMEGGEQTLHGSDKGRNETSQETKFVHNLKYFQDGSMKPSSGLPSTQGNKLDNDQGDLNSRYVTQSQFVSEFNKKDADFNSTFNDDDGNEGYHKRKGSTAKLGFKIKKKNSVLVTHLMGIKQQKQEQEAQQKLGLLRKLVTVTMVIAFDDILASPWMTSILSAFDPETGMPLRGMVKRSISPSSIGKKMSFEAGTSAVNFEMNCATGVLTIHHDVPKMLDLILSSHQKNAFSSDSSSENGLRIGSACGSSSRQNQAVETVSKIEHMFGLQVVQGIRKLLTDHPSVTDSNGMSLSIMAVLKTYTDDELSQFLNVEYQSGAKSSDATNEENARWAKFTINQLQNSFMDSLAGSDRNDSITKRIDEQNALPITSLNDSSRVQYGIRLSSRPQNLAQWNQAFGQSLNQPNEDVEEPSFLVVGTSFSPHGSDDEEDRDKTNAIQTAISRESPGSINVPTTTDAIYTTAQCTINERANPVKERNSVTNKTDDETHASKFDPHALGHDEALIEMAVGLGEALVSGSADNTYNATRRTKGSSNEHESHTPIKKVNTFTQDLNSNTEFGLSIDPVKTNGSATMIHTKDVANYGQNKQGQAAHGDATRLSKGSSNEHESFTRINKVNAVSQDLNSNTEVGLSTDPVKSNESATMIRTKDVANYAQNKKGQAAHGDATRLSQGSSNERESFTRINKVNAVSQDLNSNTEVGLSTDPLKTNGSATVVHTKDVANYAQNKKGRAGHGGGDDDVDVDDVDVGDNNNNNGDDDIITSTKRQEFYHNKAIIDVSPSQEDNKKTDVANELNRSTSSRFSIEFGNRDSGSRRVGTNMFGPSRGQNGKIKYKTLQERAKKSSDAQARRSKRHSKKSSMKRRRSNKHAAGTAESNQNVDIVAEDDDLTSVDGDVIQGLKLAVNAREAKKGGFWSRSGISAFKNETLDPRLGYGNGQRSYSGQSNSFASATTSRNNSFNKSHTKNATKKHDGSCEQDRLSRWSPKGAQGKAALLPSTQRAAAKSGKRREREQKKMFQNSKNDDAQRSSVGNDDEEKEHPLLRILVKQNSKVGRSSRRGNDGTKGAMGMRKISRVNPNESSLQEHQHRSQKYTENEKSSLSKNENIWNGGHRPHNEYDEQSADPLVLHASQLSTLNDQASNNRHRYVVSGSNSQSSNFFAASPTAPKSSQHGRSTSTVYVDRDLEASQSIRMILPKPLHSRSESASDLLPGLKCEHCVLDEHPVIYTMKVKVGMVAVNKMVSRSRLVPTLELGFQNGTISRELKTLVSPIQPKSFCADQRQLSLNSVQIRGSIPLSNKQHNALLPSLGGSTPTPHYIVKNDRDLLLQSQNVACDGKSATKPFPEHFANSYSWKLSQRKNPETADFPNLHPHQ